MEEKWGGKGEEVEEEGETEREREKVKGKTIYKALEFFQRRNKRKNMSPPVRR